MLAPEMQLLLGLIADTAIHGVVTREFSRLMRPENFSDYALLQRFVDTNTVLYLPDGPIDFASKTGRILGPLRAALAGVERIEMLEKIWGAKEEKRSAGGFAQSAVCLPYGVGYDRERGWHYTAAAVKVEEAFRLLLAGYSYTHLARLLGVTIPGVRKIISNQIYTGWRVIDERRDPSPAARRTRHDGRQGDRPKIKRAAEDVIRVQVISTPLVSPANFLRAQEILAARRRLNARTRSEGERRYTYNGFLSCACCGALVYTHHRRADYYICKGRKLLNTCQTHYMRRDLLDPKLDELFAARLRDIRLWHALAADVTRRAQAGDQKPEQLTDELNRMETRRARVLDAYFDGIIDIAERDERLRKIDGELSAVRTALSSIRPPEHLSPAALAEFFEQFDDFAILQRTQKRALLSATVPEISVANYVVTGLSLLLPCGDNFTRTDTDSSPPRA
ncbi:MAG: hypothetical protein DMF64_17005 [Acidobacteria bacterium]|nr:MAG: hypothetical protein DMF64_17005 [Acidobacteriota bacterium]